MAKFRFDAPGRGVPSAHAVMKPNAVGASTVTFNTTADTPAGTPPRPETCNATVPFGPGVVPPLPERVSSRRVGATATYAPDVEVLVEVIV